MTVDPPLITLTPAGAAVVDVITSAGGRALVVGGAVRDALLGSPSKDLDVEVHGLADVAGLADALAALGRVDHRGRAFGILALRVGGEDVDVSFPRRAPADGAGLRGFDIHADASADLTEAFGRRDFTINAMGWDPRTGELVDPYGGAADLRDHVLRHTTSAFRDDPLRVLRAVQLAGRFGLTLAPETVAECRAVIDGTGEAGLHGVVPLERVWAEWRTLARRGTDWPAAMRVLDATGLLARLPELAATRGVEQDPAWHAEGDVWTHLVLAAEQAALSAEHDGLAPGDREVAVLGALVHDLGKVTHTQHRDGRITSHGHAAAGVEPAAAFLGRIGAPRSLIARVLPLVREHMSHVGIDQPAPTQVRRLVRRLDTPRTGATLADWARVVDADCAGRGPSAKPSPTSRWLAVARADDAAGVPRTGILTGRDLIARGWTPGPEFSRVLRAALDAQDTGTVHDEQSALAWLDGYEVDRTA